MSAANQAPAAKTLAHRINEIPLGYLVLATAACLMGLVMLMSSLANERIEGIRKRALEIEKAALQQAQSLAKSCDEIQAIAASVGRPMAATTASACGKAKSRAQFGAEGDLVAERVALCRDAEATSKGAPAACGEILADAKRRQENVERILSGVPAQTTDGR